MSVEFVLNAELRDDVGKGASRRLRRIAGRVPAIVYGGETPARTISLEHKELVKALENEAFYSHLITLTAGDVTQEVILKDLQRHPAKDRILHADFLRVSHDRKISVHVPLHFVNHDKCHGVKQEGGLIQHNVNEIEISCLPQYLPEYIEVDMLHVHVGQTVHISDITLPEGVTSIDLVQGAQHDLALAVVLAQHASMLDEEEEEEGEEAGEEGTAAEGGEEV